MVEKQRQKAKEVSQTKNMTKAIEQQMRSMHEAFLQSNDGVDGATADKFIKFVGKQSGGKRLLSSVSSDKINIFWEDVKKYGVKLGTIQKNAHHYDTDNINDTDTLNTSYKRIKEHLSAHPGQWDGFQKKFGLTFATGVNGMVLTEKSREKTSIRNVQDLKAARNSFLSKEGINHPNMNGLLEDMVPSATTIMMSSIYNKTRTKIEPKQRKSFDSAIGDIDAYSNIQSVGELVMAIASRAQSNGMDDIIDDVVIRNSDIRKTYQNAGFAVDADADFTQWNKSLRVLVDNNTTLAVTSTYEGSAEYIQKTITEAQKTLSVLSPTLASLTQQYPMNEETLREASSNYHNRIDSVRDQYILAKQESQGEGDGALRAKESAQKLHKVWELLRWKARVKSIEKKNQKLATILSKGPSIDFDFSQLSKEDQCLLAYTCSAQHIEERDEEANIYGLDRERYSQFVRNMFDPQQSHITIPVGENKKISIPVKDKGFLAGGVHPSHLDFKKIEDFKHLGFSVDVEVDDNNQSAIESIVPHLFDKVKSQSISPSYRVRLTNPNTGKVREGYLMNIGEDEDISNKKKGGTTESKDCWMLYDVPPTKAGKLYPDPKIERNGEYIDDIDQCDIDILEKNLTLTGDSLDQVALGWALGDRIENPRNPEQKLDSSWSDMMDGSRNPESDTYIDTYGRELQQTDDDIDSTELIQSEFLKNFKKTVKAPDGSIDKIMTLSDIAGKTLWIQSGTSNVPPKRDSAPFWMMLKIESVDENEGTMTFIIEGSDNSIAGFEGQKHTLPLEGSTLRDMEGVAEDNTIHMLTPDTKRQLDPYVQDMNKAGLIDSSSSAMFGGLDLSSAGFVRTSDGEEVKYFGSEGSIDDPKKKSDKKIKVPYSFSVERSGDDFVVQSTSPSYKKRMSLPSLVMFIGNRGLQPMTTKEKDNFEKRTRDPKHYKRASENDEDRQGTNPYKRGLYNIASVVSFFKDGRQGLSDGLDSLQKQQTEDMTDVVLGKYNLYGKLSKLPIVGDAFSNMNADYIQERDDKVFKKITGTKDFLAQNPDGDGVVGAYVEDTIKDAKKDKIPTSRKGLHAAAGQYLYMLEEHGDPYGQCLAPYRGSGLRVKALCGEDHYKNYKLEAERVRLALEADPTNSNLLEEFADMEAKYIHQVMADNASYKKLFSKKFSDAIIGAKWKGNEPERIAKTADRFGSQKDFGLNETLFGIKMKQGDIGKTVGHLKAMAMTAQSSTQINKVRLYILELILSGMVLYQTNDKTKNAIIGIASKMGFIPGTWLKNANQQHKIQTLLDYITGGNFSTKTKYSKETFTRLNYGSNIGDFHDNFKNWANGDDGKRVSEFLSLMDIKKNPEGNLLTILGKYDESKKLGKEEDIPGPSGRGKTTEEHIHMLRNIKDGIMQSNNTGADRTLQNKYLFTAPLAIPNNVISQQLGPDRQGKLDRGDDKETMMKEQFWRSLPHHIPAKHMPHSERFFMEKFVALIPSVTDKPFMSQAILSARHHIKAGQTNTARMILKDTMRMLPLTNNMNSVDELIRGALDKYVDFFMANIGEMDESLISASFKRGGGEGGVVAKEFDKNVGLDNKNQIPKDTLNYTIEPLKKRLIRDGHMWTFFGDSGGAKKEKTKNQLKSKHHDKPVVNNVEEYEKGIQSERKKDDSQNMRNRIFDIMRTGNDEDNYSDLGMIA